MATHPGESRRRAELFNLFRSAVPPMPDLTRAPTAPRHLEVFGVGPDWAQLTWSALGPGPVRFHTDHGPDATVEADGGPGALLLDGLPDGTPVRIEVEGPGVDRVLDTVTLTRPPGELLHRLATVSDVHLGSTATGYLHTIVEIPEPEVPHPERCLAAAVAELVDWGAAELVVKGDLVDRSRPDLWATAGRVLDRSDLAVALIPGNHEWSSLGDGDPTAGARSIGLALHRGVTVLDRPGLRLAVVDSTIPGHDRGRYRVAHDDLVAAAATTDRPLLVVVHHQPTRLPFPTYLPPGVPGGESRRLCRALATANPNVALTSGHTHRNRRRRVGGITVSEVGSTKDFPGTWAGYEVYEGGLVQVVRRIADPTCIRWTDWTRRAAAGIWQLWAPGRLADRCFTLPTTGDFVSSSGRV